ncbi:Peroxisomal multifunctional enzyme type 2-like [Homarus americanus]|uniref:Peroxisomal multifunctional enzyme type 2-like n=1 Tax=Homarus americanus TaxID=6706 RepID=A0A8J5MRI5_HOMAM|nr:Peroxisomal multifunctional enzyme type 2-like [Homarus americanus]
MGGELRFDGKVAIITGAGGGLGRSYALLFGSRGAKVVVNDLGGDAKGEGKSSSAADKVVDEIRSAGGTAVANYDSVENGANIVQTALDNFGRVDILVNNAGILRDRSFARTSDTDWDLVYRVHLRGAFMVTRAAFPVMRQQKYGRIIMTASTSGIYGNFGQANYSAAKLGLLGLSNTVAIEGYKYNIHCNTIAPVGGTRLTEGLLPPDRWEHTKGSVCQSSHGDIVSPEQVRDNWEKIIDFTGSVHPASSQENSALLIGALQEISEKSEVKANPTSSPSASLTGPLSAVGVTLGPTSYTYDHKHLILYALGSGVSTKDENSLQFLYENSENFSPHPTFGVVVSQSSLMSGGGIWSKIQNWSVDFTKLLHGEMYIENIKPLPTNATLSTEMKVVDVLDKGSGAVLIAESLTKDESGDPVSRTQWSLFLVGEGNFGGPRKSTKSVPLLDPPKRKPDVTDEFKTNIDQAALYRLNGDNNPLHIDPLFAAMGGFSQPILHGLCFYGISARIILKHFCNDDVKLFKAMKARFAKTVIPGQTLVVDMWKEGSRIFFTCTIKETNQACLTGGFVDIVETASVNTSASTSMQLASGSVFHEISQRVASTPGAAEKVKAIFLWNINKNKTPAAQWTLDLKNGPGSVYEGTPINGEKPSVTLTLEDDDMVALVTGKLNAQKAFMSGKLKVSGNVMLTQKLQPFLKPQAKM